MEKARNARATDVRAKRTGTRFRNEWESNFAKALDCMGFEWAYEPTAFETPHGFYSPDFMTCGRYIDIKGRHNPEQERRIDHLLAAGEALTVIRGLGNREPNFEQAMYLLRHGEMPTGKVFL